MSNGKRETVGKIATDLMVDGFDYDVLRESEKQSNEEYLENLNLCIIDGQKKGYSGDFFIEVVIRNMGSLWNVYHRQFGARQQCPTPAYSQEVWQYHAQSGSLEFIWVVPSMAEIKDLVERSLMLTENEKIRFNYAIAAHNGVLFKQMLHLNKETDTPVVIQSM